MSKQRMTVRYCSNPDGHSPKDCPDYPKDRDAQIMLEVDKANLQAELQNMDIELDEDELEEKIHDGSLMDLL